MTFINYNLKNLNGELTKTTTKFRVTNYRNREMIDFLIADFTEEIWRNAINNDKRV